MRLIATIIFAILLSACNSSRQPTDTEFNLAHMSDFIDQANKNYGERFTNGDLEFYKNLYVQDACIMPDNLDKICGIEMIRNFNYNHGNNKGLNIFSKADDVFGGPTEVIEVGHFEMFNKNDSLFRKGKFIAIWIQDEDKWKLKYEIWNLDQ